MDLDFKHIHQHIDKEEMRLQNLNPWSSAPNLQARSVEDCLKMCEFSQMKIQVYNSALHDLHMKLGKDSKALKELLHRIQSGYD